MYTVQSASYYKDSARTARHKIKYYISENDISQAELHELFLDMKKIIQASNYFGKRQRQFLSFFDTVTEKYNLRVDQFFL